MEEDSPGLGGSLRDGDSRCDHRRVAPDLDRSRYRQLLELSCLNVLPRSRADLFKELAARVLDITGSHFLNFSLHDPNQNCMITNYWHRYEPIGEFDAFAMDESVSGAVWTSQEAIAIPDILKEKRFPQAILKLQKHGVRSYCMFPMSTASRRLGALGFGKRTPEILDVEEAEFMSRVSSVVALTIENQEGRWAAEEREKRLQVLVLLSQGMSASLELERLLPTIMAKLRQITNCDYAVVALLEEDKKFLSKYQADWAPGLMPLLRDGPQRVPTPEAMAAHAIATRSVTVWNAEDLDRLATPATKKAREAGIQSVCTVALVSENEAVGALHLGSVRRNAFRPEDSAYLAQVADLMAAALRNAGACRDLSQIKDRLTGEKRCLENEIRCQTGWDDVVGKSPVLKSVLDHASLVAATDSTVLITGETGTGKEHVARAIHNMSPRCERSFIKLNCAAIPTGLLESELFGHEKGAFTGAVSQKIGRLELADKGTLFLDEIGEIPLEMQPKLLRVLQDHEFERLGGIRTIRVDVRLIAATNRDLVHAVADKEFRSDLFYRLHVFPLHMPSLRERQKDIPLLVRHFVQKSGARLNRRVEIIPDEVMAAMLQWTWPGNIRELENFIERSVILSEGRTLLAPLSELRQEISRGQQNLNGTLQEWERDHIIDILQQTHGVLSGVSGAAARLGLKRTTLQSKMQKLGISRAQYLD